MDTFTSQERFEREYPQVFAQVVKVLEENGASLETHVLTWASIGPSGLDASFYPKGLPEDFFHDRNHPTVGWISVEVEDPETFTDDPEAEQVVWVED